MGARLRGYLTLLSLSGALGASVWAQRLLRQLDQTGLRFVVPAFLLAVIAGRLLDPLPSSSAPLPSAAAPVLRPLRPQWIVVGLSSAAVSCALVHVGHAPALQLAAWLVSVGAWLVAYVEVPSPSTRAPARSPLLAAALLLLALPACCYALQRIPGGLYGDEAALGTLINHMLDGRQPIAPFSLGLGQIPSLFFWLNALGPIGVGDGANIFGLRLMAAIGGALCVLPAFYLLRRDLGALVAAAAALLLLASPEHQHLSRMALPESWIRPTALTALAALYGALRTGAAGRYVTAGVALGCCFFMASKAVLLPPILLGATLGFVLVRWPGVLPQWRGGLLLTAAAVLTFLPQLVCYADKGWQDILIGHHARWMTADVPLGLLAHVESMARLLLDSAEFSPFSPFEQRGYVTSALEGAVIVVGLGLAVARPRQSLTAFLLGWLFAGLASLWLDSQPNQVPHAILVSCLPVMFGALVLDALQRALAAVTQRPRISALLTLGCSIPLLAGNALAYFGTGTGAAAWEGEDFTLLGRAMQEFRNTHHVALLTPPMSWDLNSTLLYLAPDYLAPTKFTELDRDKRWFDNLDQDVAFLVMIQRVPPLLHAIQERFPNASVETRADAAGTPLLAIVRVRRNDLRRAELQVSRR